MPATFPSHAAAVLPLKFWKPHWFDGIALTIGSAAPDFAYALDGTWFEAPVPNWPPLYAIAHSWYGIVMWGLPVTVAGCWIVRRTFARVSSAWLLTASSAITGAASHVVWDHLATQPLPDIVSSVIGAVLAVVFLALHFRHRVGKRHSGEELTIAWGAALGVFAAGAVWLPFLPGAALVHTTGSRIVLLTGLSLLIGRSVRTRS